MTEPAEPTPEKPTLPARPGAPRPAASVPTPVGVAREWLRRMRRGPQPTPSDPERLGVEPGDPARTSLLHRSPFQIGFLLTLGAMTAYGIVTAALELKSILILVLLALFISLGLNPLVEWLQRRRLPRSLAVLVVALGLLLVLVLSVWAVVPVVTEQGANLITSAPVWLQSLRENPQVADLDAQFQIIDKVIGFLTSGAWLSSLFGGLLGAGIVVANIVFSLTVTLVLTLYFLASLPGIKNVIYQLAPASRRSRARYLANEMFRRVGGYMTGMFLVISLWGVGSFIVFNVVGLSNYALALSLVVAALVFIPAVGSWVALAICSLIAFSVSTTTGIVVLAYFLAYQQLDAYVIQPRVFSRSLNVPAVLVILGAISGGLLLGVVGALLAIPTVASLLLLYREVLVPHLDRL